MGDNVLDLHILLFPTRVLLTELGAEVAIATMTSRAASEA